VGCRRAECVFGRYKMVSMETQDYVYGFMGATCGDFDEVKKQVLRGIRRGRSRVTVGLRI